MSIPSIVDEPKDPQITMNHRESVISMSTIINKAHRGVRTICLDFDGVIHSYKSGWKGMTNIPDPPVEGVWFFIFILLFQGYRVAVHGCRSRSWFGRRAMKKYIKKHFSCDFNNISFPKHKPIAHMYIDDRAYRFDGDFPLSSEIAAFKPWNRKKMLTK